MFHNSIIRHDIELFRVVVGQIKLELKTTHSYASEPYSLRIQSSGMFLSDTVPIVNIILKYGDLSSLTLSILLAP